jgi:hypothetical protein
VVSNEDSEGDTKGISLFQTAHSALLSLFLSPVEPMPAPKLVSLANGWQQSVFGKLE